MMEGMMILAPHRNILGINLCKAGGRGKEVIERKNLSEYRDIIVPDHDRGRRK
jgi:hypothetical protein